MSTSPTPAVGQVWSERGGSCQWRLREQTGPSTFDTDYRWDEGSEWSPRGIVLDFEANAWRAVFVSGPTPANALRETGAGIAKPCCLEARGGACLVCRPAKPEPWHSPFLDEDLMGRDIK